MNKLLAAVAAATFGCLAAAHANEAKITDEKQIDDRLIELTISTPAFTVPTKVQVNLPVGYSADSAKRWPVTYYLAGTNHTYADFNGQYEGERLTLSFDSIVVSPNGGSGYWSDWYNNGALGPPMYETYVINQLIPLIDDHFITVGTRSGRAIIGESMGGYGVMMLAARHPDLFAAAASVSGGVDTNLIVNGSVVSASPLLDMGLPDAIYGPRATQEIRWRGHNPADLADNLRDVDLQVSSANGTPAPAIGERLADVPGCVLEILVNMGSTSFDAALNAHDIPHRWQDYGAGCHSIPNFQRQITDALPIFARVFAKPRPPPTSFNFMSIEPMFDIWGWHVEASPARPLEFLRMRDVGQTGLTLLGSGITRVITPPLFRDVPYVNVIGGEPAKAIPDVDGRIRFEVDLGIENARQQYSPASITTLVSRTVTLHAEKAGTAIGEINNPELTGRPDGRFGGSIPLSSVFVFLLAAAHRRWLKKCRKLKSSSLSEHPFCLEGALASGHLGMCSTKWHNRASNLRSQSWLLKTFRRARERSSRSASRSGRGIDGTGTCDLAPQMLRSPVV